MANVLYISILGMSEPLGKSQVLEYLKDLSKEHNIYLHTFEKETDQKTIGEIHAIMHVHNIHWTYQKYNNKYGVISTIYQILSSYFILRNIIKRASIDIIHARSLIPAVIGVTLKCRHVKLLFDIRAFQIDEKAEAGRIKKNSIFYKILKYIENKMYAKSDHIVTLTYASASELNSALKIQTEKLTVIPTCANKEVFKCLTDDEKNQFKSALGYDSSERVVIHIGDVRERYDFDLEVKVFKRASELDSTLRFLIVNRGSEHPYIEHKLQENDLDTKLYKIKSSDFYDVYKYLGIADVSLFFIRPTYSRMAMAPTKFAENLACHVPSFTNMNVGDMKQFMEENDVGLCIDLNQKDSKIDEWAQNLIKLAYETLPAKNYEVLFNKYFDKDIAVKKYSKIYLDLLGEK